MSDLPQERNFIQEEETRPKASTSTSVMSRLGQNQNFIMARMHQEKIWTANGPYNAVPGVQSGIDSGIPLPINMEIWALSMMNLVPGASGFIEFDIKRHTASGQAGTSIFTTRPRLDFSSGINSYLVKRFDDNTTPESPAGCQQPVLVSMNVDAGDMFTCDITSKQVNGESGGIILHLRPR
jgi:hypothetical protein